MQSAGIKIDLNTIKDLDKAIDDWDDADFDIVEGIQATESKLAKQIDEGIKLLTSKAQVIEKLMIPLEKSAKELGIDPKQIVGFGKARTALGTSSEKIKTLRAYKSRMGF